MSRRQAPPATHIHLVLLKEAKDDNEFYLEVPVAVIRDLVIAPFRYLCYLGWCVLGREGVLQHEDGEPVIDLDAELDTLTPGGTYRYYVAGT
jgi:hypothetical protein